jgi:hypothetical protein
VIVDGRDKMRLLKLDCDIVYHIEEYFKLGLNQPVLVALELWLLSNGVKRPRASKSSLHPGLPPVHHLTDFAG